MTTITEEQVQAVAAKRIWCATSRGVNHPSMCAPSIELVEELSNYYPLEEVADHIWRLWKLVRRTCHLPGFQRPLGSCYHPRVADLLDVAYGYGNKSGEVFRRINKAAGTIATTFRGKWWRGLYGYDRGAGTHIGIAPGLVSQLADAARQGTAPAVEALDHTWFVPNWDATVAEAATLTDQLGELEKLAGCRVYFNSYHPSMAEHRSIENVYDDEHPEYRGHHGLQYRKLVRQDVNWQSVTETDGTVTKTPWHRSVDFWADHPGCAYLSEATVCNATYALHETSFGSGSDTLHLWPGFEVETVKAALAKRRHQPAKGDWIEPTLDYVDKNVVVNVVGLTELQRELVPVAIKKIITGKLGNCSSRVVRGLGGKDAAALLMTGLALRLLREKRVTWLLARFDTKRYGDETYPPIIRPVTSEEQLERALCNTVGQTPDMADLLTSWGVELVG